MRYVTRHLGDTVRRSLRTFPAILVTGARQAGKTTFLRREFGRTHAYVSIERPDVRDRALADPVAFLQERGGFPEPRLHPRVDRDLWFSGYVATYLERDVRNLAQVGDLGAFGRFVRLVASRNGTMLNMTDLGRDAGITGPTAKHWLAVLEASHLVYLLRPYHRSFGKRIRKSPKLYVTDPGLVTHLIGLHLRPAVMQGPSLGPLTEAAVLGEWLKAFRTRGMQPQLHYWRSSNGHEVDLVIEHERRLFAVEVKATATPTPQHAESLARWMEIASSDARGILACRIEDPVSLRPGIRAVPWHLAW